MEHQCSQLIRDYILNEEVDYGYDILNEHMQKRAQVSSENRHSCQEEAKVVRQQLLGKLQKALELAEQKVHSLSLTVLPLTEHGFTLHKAAFNNAFSLKYGWLLNNMPFTCDNQPTERSLSQPSRWCYASWTSQPMDSRKAGM